MPVVRRFLDLVARDSGRRFGSYYTTRAEGYDGGKAWIYPLVCQNCTPLSSFPVMSACGKCRQPSIPNICQKFWCQAVKGSWELYHRHFHSSAGCSQIMISDHGYLRSRRAKHPLTSYPRVLCRRVLPTIQSRGDLEQHNKSSRTGNPSRPMLPCSEGGAVKFAG